MIICSLKLFRVHSPALLAKQRPLVFYWRGALVLNSLNIIMATEFLAVNDDEESNQGNNYRNWND